MSRSLPGFEALLTVSLDLGWNVWLGPPAARVPPTVLGGALDPDLSALLARHDGAQLRGDAYALFVRGLSQPESLENDNAGLRRVETGAPYPFDGLLAFAQVGYQASYIACVHRLADVDGRQPVVYLDTHEAPWAVPIASSVDRAFALLARHVRRAFGEGADGVFPWDAVDLVREDPRVLELAACHALDAWLGPEAAAREWAEALTRRR